MKVTLTDINDYDNTVTLSESERGNVVVIINRNGFKTEVIVKPDELLRAARLFVTTNTGDTDT